MSRGEKERIPKEIPVKNYSWDELIRYFGRPGLVVWEDAKCSFRAPLSELQDQRLQLTYTVGFIMKVGNSFLIIHEISTPDGTIDYSSIPSKIIKKVIYFDG